MTKGKFLTATVAISVLAASPAAAVFELQGPTPRGVALGGATSAIIDDASAIYYNPAGLASVRGTEFGFAHNRIGNFDFLQHNLAWGATELGSFGNLGGSVRVFTTESGDGDKLSTELSVSIAHGVMLMRDVHSSLAFGWAMHYHQLDFGASAGTYVPGTDTYVNGIDDLGSDGTVAFDVGVRASLESRVFASAVLRNLNRPHLGTTDRVELLESLALGAAYEPYPQVLTTAEVEVRSGEMPSILRAGVEYQVAQPFTIRLGVGSDPARFSGGFRVDVSHFALDYAFGDHPILPASHHIGVGVQF